jgi:hypothetical protein
MDQVRVLNPRIQEGIESAGDRPRQGHCTEAKLLVAIGQGDVLEKLLVLVKR